MHDDLEKLADVQVKGWGMDLATVVRWRYLQDEIVTAVHDVVNARLSE